MTLLDPAIYKTSLQDSDLAIHFDGIPGFRRCAPPPGMTIQYYRKVLRGFVFSIFDTNSKAGKSLKTIFRDNESGQYMVEFGLTFAFFILFMIFVMDIGLMIYNHNLFYRGVVQATRTASLGGSNEEINDTLHEKAIDNYFPGILSEVTVDTYQITPQEEINRVNGTEVTIEMRATFGIYVMGLIPITLEVPIESRSLIFQVDDQDRDGCKDSLEGPGVSCNSYDDFDTTLVDDHDNDGGPDEYHFEAGTDTDADNDGIDWYSDTIAIGYTVDQSGLIGDGCEEGYHIYQPHTDLPDADDCSFGGIDDWGKLGVYGGFDGWYHAPERWDDNSEARWRVFARELPNFHVIN